MGKLDKRNIENIFALTPLQEGILFHYLRDPKSDIYFEQICLEVSGELKIPIFEKAWNFVVEINEMLRTTFRWEKVENPVQIILKQHRLHPMYYDLTGGNAADTRKQLEKIKLNDRGMKFNLREIPFRVTLCKTGKDRFEIIISNHHILFDGWSLSIILEEFFDAYNAFTNDQFPPKIVKGKFVEFLQWIGNREVEKQKEFWTGYLKGIEGKTELSIKRKLKGGIKDSEKYGFILPMELVKKAEDLIIRHKITIAVVFYFAWGLILQKYNSSEDVIFGTTVSGRNPNIKGIEGIVGLFINTIPLRIRTHHDEMVKDLLYDVQDVIFKREKFDNTPLVDIMKYSGLSGLEELFDSIMVIENYPIDSIIKERKDRFNPLVMESYTLSETTNYDLTIGITLLEDVEVVFSYNKTLFEMESIVRLAEHFTNAFQEIINQNRFIREIGIISPQEKNSILYDFNKAPVDLANEKIINELFEEQVARIPDNIALEYNDTQVTYLELNIRTNQVACILRSLGSKPSDIISIMIDRSMDMVIGIYAIIKAGGAYLPIEPAYPIERKKFMLEDSHSNFLLTWKNLGRSFAERHQVIDLDKIASDNVFEVSKNFKWRVSLKDKAYVMYTSGSTGKPKGVIVTQESLVNILFALFHGYSFSKTDAYLLKTSYGFDVSLTELFGWFLGGGKLSILEKEAERNSHKILAAVERRAVTHINFAPTVFNTFLDFLKDVDFSGIHSLKYIFLAGETVWPELVKKFRSLQTNIRLENLYGPTEAAIYASNYSLANWNGNGNISIGKPFPNVCIYVLDKDNQLQAVGVPGQLCIAGVGVAQGYLNRPALTDEMFVKNPFHAGNKLFKSGDIARWLPDGIIEFIGRADRQVKIGGIRIEPGEIERWLESHPHIKEIVITKRVDENDDGYLCAYFVSDMAIKSNELRKFLSNVLPQYMIPAYFVQIPGIPLTASGKIDIKALPATGSEISTPYSPPRSKIEETLLTIFSKVLRLPKERIGIDDNFFELGGDSLKLIRLISRIYKSFDTELSISDIFDVLTVRGVSELLRKAEVGLYKSIKKTEKKECYPISSAQKRLYILHQMDPFSNFYNLLLPLFLEGHVDEKKLKSSLKKLLIRHESLRTSFETVDSTPVQRVHDSREFEIVEWEVFRLKSGDGETEINWIIHDFVKPFNLSKPPLFRAGIIKLGDKKNLLIVDMHHIVSDGHSMEIFVSELIELYKGNALPELRLNYRDYTQWQKSNELEKIREQQALFWKERFEGEIPILNLPTDFQRPLVYNFTGDTIRFEINSQTSDILIRFAVENQVTIYTLLLTIYGIFLSKLTGQEDIIVGIPALGRRHTDLEPLIGMFVNTLCTRNFPIGEKTSREFLFEVKANMIEALDNQDYQFEDLVANLQIDRDTSRNPIFDTMLTLQNLADFEIEIPGVKISQYDYVNEISKFDLTLHAVLCPHGLKFSFEYCTSLFKKSTVERFTDYFKNILYKTILKPGTPISEISIITESEKEKILHTFNHKILGAFRADRTIHQLFEEQAAQKPDKIAAVFEDKTLKDTESSSRRFLITYKELNKRANRLARNLKSMEVKGDTIVGLMVERSLAMLTGIIGILKTGGAYLPIDPDYPEERIQYMLKDSGAKVLIINRKTALNFDNETIYLDEKKFPQGDSTDLKNLTHSSNLAYVLYTSGTTGKPKGTLIEHRNVVGLLSNGKDLFGFDENDIWTMFHSYCFDFSGWEMYGALLFGGKLIVISRIVARDSTRFLETLIHERVTILNQTPSAFESLLHAEKIYRYKSLCIRYVIFGGESLNPAKLKDWKIQYPDIKLINMYGITETTIHSTYKEIGELEIVSDVRNIGRPLPNCTTYVMDKYLKLVPIGVIGELCIGGRGVGRGYLNRMELTATRWGENPYKPLEITYRSGDLVRWLDNGEMEYLGRVDFQLKIRGFRIELGEIENQLLRYEGIKDVFVIAKEKDKGDRYLCAYVVSEIEFSLFELKDYLSSKLPDYMIPSYFVRLEKMPLTPNGKVDTKALPAPEKVRIKYVPPQSEMELMIAAMWKDILNLDRVGVIDNFFDIGGNSIRVISLSIELKRMLGRDIPIVALYNHPTIRSFLDYFENQRNNDDLVTYKDSISSEDKDKLFCSRQKLKSRMAHMRARRKINEKEK